MPVNSKPRSADKIVGERLRTARERRGMSQRELADKIGITHVQLSLYERGAVRIILATFLDLCRHLGENPTRLLAGLCK
jgi:transcriptional regulator with XRE-family HTH domain